MKESAGRLRLREVVTKALKSELNMIEIIKALKSESSIVLKEKQNYRSNARMIDVKKEVEATETYLNMLDDDVDKADDKGVEERRTVGTGLEP